MTDKKGQALLMGMRVKVLAMSPDLLKEWTPVEQGVIQKAHNDSCVANSPWLPRVSNAEENDVGDIELQLNDHCGSLLWIRVPASVVEAIELAAK